MALRHIVATTALGAAVALGWRAQRRADERAIAADPEWAELSRAVAGKAVGVESPDGTRLHAEVFGAEDGPTIVLVHGWMCSLELWQYQIRELISDYRVVAYDLRGHGESEYAANGDYSIDALVADLDAVLAACVSTGQKAVVVGHSMGAMSVVAWAGAHPDEVGGRLAGAVLSNTGVERLIAEARVVITAAALSRVKQLVGPWVLDLPLPAPRRASPLISRVVRYLALSDRAGPAQVAFCTRMFLRCRPDVRAAFGATLAGIDLVFALSALVVPTVVVASELDRLTPPVHARAMVRVLPDAELVELPGTGHTAPLEAHIDLTAQIRDLARRTLVDR